MESIGGSSGSYSHGAQKSDNDKSKRPHRVSEKKGHYKSEGSGSKPYSRSGKSSGHGYKKNYGARGGHGGRHASKNPADHLLRFKNKLNLTESQMAEIKRLQFAYEKKRIRNKAEHKIAHMEYDKLVHIEKVDAQAIRSAAEKITKLITQKIMEKAEMKIALLNLLTAEQRKKTHAMHSAHSPR